MGRGWVLSLAQRHASQGLAHIEHKNLRQLGCLVNTKGRRASWWVIASLLHLNKIRPVSIGHQGEITGLIHSAFKTSFFQPDILDPGAHIPAV